jgi:hypothetical protein
MEFDLVESSQVVKPKRKYVRKKQIGNEPLTKEMFESIKSNLKRKIHMMLNMTAYRSGSAASKWVEAYIDNILKYINGDNRLRSHVSNLHDIAHYASYRIIIFDYNEDTTKGYNKTHMSFKMEELHSNCSSIGIHHFDGHIIPDNSIYSNNSPAFDSVDKFKMFLAEIEELAAVFGYTNIFYTTSSESVKCFREYVEATATKIDSFTNKRSHRVINYYSKRI